MIQVRPFPPGDSDFAARAREAIKRVCGDALVQNGHLVAPSEGDLRKALSFVRQRYPDVWIRRQETVANVDGTEAWYLFRDETITTGRHLEGRRTRA